jgi:hypothetical protein
MTTTDAFNAVKDRIVAAITDVSLAWQNEDFTVPDLPASFIRIDMSVDNQFAASFGGGLGSNRWRNTGFIEAHAFVPVGQGFAVASDLAERVATLFRGYRDGTISCFSARIEPGAADGNYWRATAVIDLQFDLIG